MNIGLFGGTFDPPHLGHLIAAQDASEALALDRLLFVPAAQPPHKRDRQISPAGTRLEMLQAAVADNPQFEICTLELARSGPSYTVDTLRRLHAEQADDTLFLLIGVDQVRDFRSWREPDAILALSRVVMLARGGEAQAVQADFLSGTVPVTRCDISSTLIRGRAADGRPIRYLVPDAVAEIIAREKLYRD